MKNKTSKKSDGIDKKDRYTIVLEGVRSDIKGIAEGVMMANEKMDREFKGINEKFGLIDKRFDGVDKKFDKVNENLQLVRTEVSLIRHNQVTRDEFKFLEDRVFTIENKIAK